MTPMDDALEEVREGRRHLLVALNILKQQRHHDEEELRPVVGTSAGMATSWEVERDRWR